MRSIERRDTSRVPSNVLVINLDVKDVVWRRRPPSPPPPARLPPSSPSDNSRGINNRGDKKGGRLPRAPENGRENGQVEARELQGSTCRAVVVSGVPFYIGEL